MALEWDAYRRSLCSGCGLPRHETFDPDGPDYHAEAWRCRACEVRDVESRKWSKDDHASTAGLFIAVKEGTDG